MYVWYSMCAQLCPTLCDSMGCSLPGSSAHRIFQAKIHFLLQGIVPTHDLNPHSQHLLHWLVDSLPLAPPRKPKSKNIRMQITLKV